MLDIESTLHFQAAFKITRVNKELPVDEDLLEALKPWAIEQNCKMTDYMLVKEFFLCTFSAQPNVKLPEFLTDLKALLLQQIDVEFNPSACVVTADFFGNDKMRSYLYGVKPSQLEPPSWETIDPFQ